MTNKKTIHILKIHPQFLDPLISGEKTFEIRKNDRNYKVGDTLRLQEWDPITERYLGRTLDREITYLTAFNQAPGWIVMALKGVQK